MDNEVQPAETSLNHSDGTISGAVLDMNDIDLGEGQPGPARDESGKFKSTKAPEEAAEIDDDGAGEDDEDIKATAPETAENEDDDEDDWIELPGEDEEAEPERVKLTDAIDGYRRAKELESELDNIKQATPAPPDYDGAVENMLGQFRQLGQHIEEWQMANPIRPPSEELINPNSQHYNPELYHVQLQNARALAQQHEHAKQARQQAQQKEQEHQDELERVRWVREEAKILENWPELQQRSARMQLASDLEAAYGLDAENLQGIRDSRAFSIIKDALAYRKSKETAKKVVKATKQKPKLVRQKARDGDPKQRRGAAAMKRLSSSHDISDAADAIGNLGIL